MIQVRGKRYIAAAICAWAALVSAAAIGQESAAQNSTVAAIDPELRVFIARTKAIDNHAHPLLPPPAEATDRNFDALPVDNMVPQTDPVAWRADNPQLVAAWATLWGFKGTPPLDDAGMRALDAARERVRQREGAWYSMWVLDQAGIHTMLANRVSLGPGVEPPRFRWVPYMDALLFPLDNSGLEAQTPDRAQLFPLEDRVRAQYLKAAGMDAIPPTLDEYLSRVVTPTLERQKREGAVAEKFEIAYLRSFGFAVVPRAEAAAAYAKYARGGRPGDARYKALQDHLFRYIARECGRLGMPVHLHTMAGGGRYFGVAGGQPVAAGTALQRCAVERHAVRDVTRRMAVCP